jgi:hypothetical protein
MAARSSRSLASPTCRLSWCSIRRSGGGSPNATTWIPGGGESLASEKFQQQLVKVVRHRLKDFPGYTKVRRMIPFTDMWSVDNVLLTPMLKVMHLKGLEKYRDAIESLYASGPVGR